VAESVISAADFDFVARLLRDQCGLVLEPGKEYLIKARLTPISHKHGLTLEELLQRLRDYHDAPLLTAVVEAMVTTETSFFRDIQPFETLKKTVLPQLIELRRSQRQLNVWCAASSSGQEPYSVALLIREYFPELASWRIHLSATDLSHEMLERSRAGRFSQLEVNRGLPTPLLLKWFLQEGAFWQIAQTIRSGISFSRMNLTQPWPAMPKWDLILLRNVMIYFDNAAKKEILGRVARVLSRDGYLLLGGSETTLNLDDSFRRAEDLRTGFYQLKPL